MKLQELVQKEHFRNSGHIQKGIDMSKYFQKLIDSATLSSADAKVAQNILNSFKSVLGGK